MTADVLEVSDPLIAEVLDRASRGYERWEQLVAQAGYCRRPVRLVGRVNRVEAETGEIQGEVYSTAREPDGVLLTACGNRRASVCPPCSETYRGDAYHLVAAGLRGGKGMPESVASHPRLFVTFTAPSFGVLHARRVRGHSVAPCHPRRARRCEHGRPVACWRPHGEDDPLVGEPLCAECFDNRGQVLWNAAAPELWRRTITYLPRALAREVGVRAREIGGFVKVRYVKVAEFQGRGAIHFHAVFRLDAAGEDPREVAPPPEEFSAEVLEAALRRAVAEVRAPVPGDDTRCAVWGKQLDIRRIRGRGPETITAAEVARYVAKYATKGAEAVGGLEHPIEEEAELEHLHAPPLIAALVRAAWDLGLRRWAHQLGFGGHFCTKSRRYSTTMTELRRARAEHAKERARRCLGREVEAIGQAEDLEEQEAPVVVGRWIYAGQGYRSEGEAWLALSAAARARERREVARLEFYTRTA